MTDKLEQWHKFGERTEVSYDELADVGRVLLGWSPRTYAWIRLNADRTAYQVGPRMIPEP